MNWGWTSYCGSITTSHVHWFGFLISSHLMIIILHSNVINQLRLALIADYSCFLPPTLSHQCCPFPWCIASQKSGLPAGGEQPLQPEDLHQLSAHWYCACGREFYRTKSKLSSMKIRRSRLVSRCSHHLRWRWCGQGQQAGHQHWTNVKPPTRIFSKVSLKFWRLKSQVIFKPNSKYESSKTGQSKI